MNKTKIRKDNKIKIKKSNNKKTVINCTSSGCETSPETAKKLKKVKGLDFEKK